MKLFLLRHADALPGGKDALRELSPNGIESIKKLVEIINLKELDNVGEIRHSPLVRARQTAEQFQSETGLKAIKREVPLLEPYDDFRILADIVSKSEVDLLLVGHQPNLSMLASYLLTQDPRFDLFSLKKTGLMCLEKRKKETSAEFWELAWQLRWAISPAQLKKR